MKTANLFLKSATVLSRAEMKNVRGGVLENTWLCDCGPNTTCDVYGTNAIEAYNNYYDSGQKCSTGITCVRDNGNE
jgi:hypothetical protein